jgi:hypothetical protein
MYGINKSKLTIAKQSSKFLTLLTVADRAISILSTSRDPSAFRIKGILGTYIQKFTEAINREGSLETNAEAKVLLREILKTLLFY